MVITSVHNFKYLTDRPTRIHSKLCLCTYDRLKVLWKSADAIFPRSESSLAIKEASERAKDIEKCLDGAQ